MAKAQPEVFDQFDQFDALPGVKQVLPGTPNPGQVTLVTTKRSKAALEERVATLNIPDGCEVLVKLEDEL